MFANRLVAKAGVVCALAVAALVSPPATKQASAMTACYVCGDATLCPLDVSMLQQWNYSCEAQCGYGTYVGACSDGDPLCGVGRQTLECYFEQ